MVYKRYIKKNGKTFGPYYYKSYRDETGKTKTKLVSIPRENKFSVKLIYVLIAFSLILILSFFILSNNSEKISIGESKILGNFIKLMGFDVENSQQEVVENPPEIIEKIIENPESSEEPIDEPSSKDPVDEPQTIEEIVPESQESTENSTEVISEVSPEINQTEIITENNNQTNEIETNISTDNSQILNNSVTAQENISSTNESLQNISEINQTITENLTIIGQNKTIQENNFTIGESTIQYGGKLGQPVKWKKTLKLDAETNETLNNLEIILPKTAGNVSVAKIFANESVEELKVNVKNEKIISETEPIISITGQSVKNQDKNNILSNLKVINKIFKFFGNFFTLVGRVIDIGENENAVLVNIQEELEDNDEIEIEYYTEAPYS